MSDNWYRYLTREGTSLLKNEKIDLKQNLVICRQSVTGREFRVFSNYIDFWKYFNTNNTSNIRDKVIKTRYRYDEIDWDYIPISTLTYVENQKKEKKEEYEIEYCYYEVLLPESRRRPFFEIDFYTNRLPREYIPSFKVDDPPDVVIHEIVRHINDIIPDPEINVFKSYSEGRDCFQIVINNYYLNNYAECFLLYQKIKDLVKEDYRRYFNDYVYKKIEHVRIYKSCKLYKYNVKELYDFCCMEKELVREKNRLKYDPDLANFRKSDPVTCVEEEVNRKLFCMISLTALIPLNSKAYV